MQVSIKWGLQHDTSVVFKGTGEEHIVGELDVLDWELSSEDYEVRLQTSPCLPACHECSHDAMSILWPFGSTQAVVLFQLYL